MDASTLLYALLGGFLPALFWLWFWLKEDRLHPEPRSLIMLSFFAGMIAVLFALPAERWIANLTAQTAIVIIGWAVIEEALKYGAAHFAALWRREKDEPIDSIIYLITAALGFAALENVLFLSSTFTEGGLIQGFDLGLLRFVGASLLHVVTSGALGFFLALGFYRRRSVKTIDRFCGLCTAIALHAVFNIYILKGDGNGGATLAVFSFVWLGVILLLVGFEKIKRLRA
jgi:protease PrsW